MSDLPPVIGAPPVSTEMSTFHAPVGDNQMDVAHHVPIQSPPAYVVTEQPVQPMLYPEKPTHVEVSHPEHTESGEPTCVDEIKSVVSTPRFQMCQIVVSAIFGIILLALSISSYMALAIAAADVENLVNTWTRLPYSDVTTVPNTQQCGAGYTAIAGPTFPGTFTSCDCPSTVTPPATATFKTPGLYIQACNSSQNWCTQYNSVSSQSLNWRGVTFCAKTYLSNAMSGMNRPRTTLAKGCPTGFTACNSGATASTELFCTDTPGVCPVTSVSISLSVQAGSNCSQLVGGSPYYLCKKFGGASYPVVFSNFQDAGFPCMPAADDANTRSKTDVRKGTLSSCRQQDTRWMVADSLTPQDVYASTTLNGISIPGQPSSPNNYSRFLSAPAAGTNYYYASSDFPNIVYAAQPEVQWDQSCQVTRSRIASLVDQVRTVRQGTLGVLIISALSLVFIDIIIGFLEFKSLYNGEGEHDTAWKYKNGFSVCVAIAKIVIIIVQYQAAMLLGDLTTVANNPCSDSLTQSSFSLLSTTSNGVITNSKVLLALAVIGILSTLFDCYKRVKQNASA